MSAPEPTGRVDWGRMRTGGYWDPGWGPWHALPYPRSWWQSTALCGVGGVGLYRNNRFDTPDPLHGWRPTRGRARPQRAPLPQVRADRPRHPALREN